MTENSKRSIKRRIEELEEQLASEGFTDGDAQTTATEPYPDLTPAANEYLDLVFGVSPKRQLERRMG